MRARKGGYGWIDDVAPGYVACVIKRQKFIAVKAVLAVNERVKKKAHKGKQGKDAKVAAKPLAEFAGWG